MAIVVTQDGPVPVITAVQVGSVTVSGALETPTVQTVTVSGQIVLEMTNRAGGSVGPQGPPGEPGEPGAPGAPGPGALYISAADPGAPTATPALWVRTAENLVQFVDFRTMDDGGLPATSNGDGFEDPSTLFDSSSLLPEALLPVQIRNGAYRGYASGGLNESVAALPFPNNPSSAYRVTMGLADFTDQTGTAPGLGTQVNLATTDGSGAGYVVYVVPVNVSGSAHTKLQLCRDDYGIGVMIEEVVVPRLLGRGDRIGLGWDGSTGWTGYLNDEPFATMDEDTFDPTTFLAVAIPNGSVSGHWFPGVEWLAVVDGDADYDPQLRTVFHWDAVSSAWERSVTPDHPAPYFPERIAALAADAGVAGPSGAPGASAYEVAVANGFVGNEAAWLASLVGTAGTPGASGAPGADALWNFLGAYSGGAAYAVGDVVTYGGETWYRINSNGGNVGDTPAEGTFWTKVAAKGAQGEQGIPGTTASVSGNLTGIDSVSTLDYVQFDTAPTGANATARLMWNATDGSLDLGMEAGTAAATVTLGQQSFQMVTNDSGSAIATAKAVYISGSSGNRVSVGLAKADAEATSSKTLGLTAESISNNQAGYVITEGLIHGINTTGLTEGALVWLSAATGGELTSTRPSAPNHGVLIGLCVRSQSQNGAIFVKIANGYELDELHNVSITTTPADGSVLGYTASTGLWSPTTRATTTHAATHSATGSDALTLAQSQVTNLTSDLSAKVATSRIVSAGTGLTGGGDLTSDRTLSVNLSASDIPSLDAAKVTTGTFASSLIASGGTASASVFLRGDRTWQQVGFSNSLSGSVGRGIPNELAVYTVASTAALTANRLYVHPIFVSQPITITQAQFEVSTAAASTNVVVGIYRAAVTNNRVEPTTLLSSFGASTTATTGSKTLSSLSVSVTPGFYCLAWLSDGAPTLRTVIGYPLGGMAGITTSGSSNLFIGLRAAYLSQTYASTLPSNAPSGPVSHDTTGAAANPNIMSAVWVDWTLA